jgi:hypothetical protein
MAKLNLFLPNCGTSNLSKFHLLHVRFPNNKRKALAGNQTKLWSIASNPKINLLFLIYLLFDFNVSFGFLTISWDGLRTTWLELWPGCYFEFIYEWVYIRINSKQIGPIYRKTFSLSHDRFVTVLWISAAPKTNNFNLLARPRVIALLKYSRLHLLVLSCCFLIHY